MWIVCRITNRNNVGTFDLQTRQFLKQQKQD